MKSVAEIAIVALIGTFTIMAGIIIPPTVIKTTIDKETILAYKFEKAQHGLSSLLSSTQDGKPVYELMGKKILFGNSIDLTKSQNNFNKVIGTSYCILVDPEIATNDILSNNVCRMNAVFNTIIVVPYNKESLVKVMGIGIE